jgi:glycerophosphoryl diester phosphodiesterase
VGERPAAYLTTLPAERQATISVYGGDASADAVVQRPPQIRATSRKIMKECLVRYLATGWSGHVPDACRHTELHLSARYGRWLWGWPNLFADRMRDADTRAVLVAGDGHWSEGFDRPADVPSGWSGWLWSNRVDAVMPQLRP